MKHALSTLAIVALIAVAIVAITQISQPPSSSGASAAQAIDLVPLDVATLDTASERCTLGPLQGLPTFFNTTALTTTPVKVTIPAGPDGTPVACIRVKLVNGHATNAIAWKDVVLGATAPTSGNMTADFASTGASFIAAGGTEFITLQPNRDLYVVASGASTSVNATSFLMQ